MKNTELIARARETASKGISAWGDLLNELTDALEKIPPPIGQPWPGQGGIYAGIIGGRNGAPDYHLLLAPADTGEIQKIEWGKQGEEITGADSYHDGRANTAAMAAAGLVLAQRITALQIDGHADYHLPSQAEAHLLAANLKEQFYKTDWYWTSTQYSAYDAWHQGFGDGSQYDYYKSWQASARAVRRFDI